jgi:hypothetical protein
MTIELTDNEQKVLKSLANNNYGDYGDGVWSWAVNDSQCPSGIEGNALSGVVGSLVKKGLFRSEEYERNEWVLWRTEAGLEAMKQYGFVA